MLRQISSLGKAARATPNPPPSLNRRDRKEGKRWQSQPDSNRASILSKVGSAAGQTENLFGFGFTRSDIKPAESTVSSSLMANVWRRNVRQDAERAAGSAPQGAITLQGASTFKLAAPVKTSRGPRMEVPWAVHHLGQETDEIRQAQERQKNKK